MDICFLKQLFSKIKRVIKLSTRKIAIIFELETAIVSEKPMIICNEYAFF